MIKSLFITFCYFFSFVWKIIPFFLRKYFFLIFFVTETRGKNHRSNLKSLFAIKDYLELIINEQALAYGKKIHPKHHLINYKGYFLNNIDDGDTVLDVGCSYGVVSREIANYYQNSNVIGIDNDKSHIDQALSLKNPPNLKFLLADATQELPINTKIDIVIVSNILEHIDQRRKFLKDIKKNIPFKKMLMRVPLFERDWQMPLRKELGVNYFSDNDHKIEHTLNEFKNEIMDAGLFINNINTLWGEIWAVVTIKKKS